VIEAAVEGVESTASSHEIALDLDLPHEPCEIHGDYDRLRQVTWNLLSNAIKFTPAGGLVRVRLACANQSYVLSVNDSGAGISPAFVAHVFERFRQADGSTTREQGGLGLGLAIVKELVELHGGTVTAESPGPGRGSTFTIRLPRTVASRPAASDPSAIDDSGPRLDGVRVMVVDDNPDAIEVLGTALETAGAHVRTESAGLSAVSAWQQEPADVLLCDLAMPGIDGFEVLRRIRAIDAAEGRVTSALAVTAYASEDYRIRCINAGFIGHLAKPYNLSDVVRAVATAVAH
jgi:CheY-like chemotaxis protein